MRKLDNLKESREIIFENLRNEMGIEIEDSAHNGDIGFYASHRLQESVRGILGKAEKELDTLENQIFT